MPIGGETECKSSFGTVNLSILGLKWHSNNAVKRKAFCGSHSSNLICVSGLKRSIRTDFIKSLLHSDSLCWSVSTAQHSLTAYSTLSKNSMSSIHSISINIKRENTG